MVSQRPLAALFPCLVHLNAAQLSSLSSESRVGFVCFCSLHGVDKQEKTTHVLGSMLTIALTAKTLWRTASILCSFAPNKAKMISYVTSLLPSTTQQPVLLLFLYLFQKLNPNVTQRDRWNATTGYDKEFNLSLTLLIAAVCCGFVLLILSSLRRRRLSNNKILISDKRADNNRCQQRFTGFDDAIISFSDRQRRYLMASSTTDLSMSSTPSGGAVTTNQKDTLDVSLHTTMFSTLGNFHRPIKMARLAHKHTFSSSRLSC